MSILLLADRSLKGNGLLCDLHYLAHLIGAHAHFFAYFVGGSLSPELLEHLALISVDLVDRLDHVDGDPYRSRLVGNCTVYRLAYPPCRICRKLVALGVIELFDSLHQTEVTLLGQVKEEHSLTDISLCDADDKTQVRLNELVLRRLTLFGGL